MNKTVNAWLSVTSATCFFFFGILQLGLFNTLSPYILHDFSLSSTQLGFLASLYLITITLIFIPSGVLLDKYLTRRPALIALAIALIGTFIFAFYSNFWTAALYRIAAGIGNGLGFLTAMRVANYWFPNKKALAISLTVSFAMTGGIVAGVPTAALIHHFGWSNTILVDACIGSALFCFMFFCLQNHPEEHARQHDVTLEKIKAVFRTKQNAFCGAYIAGLNLSIYVLAAVWSNLLLTNQFGLTSAQAALVSSMIFVGMIIGAPCFGSLSDWMQKRKPAMRLGSAMGLMIMIVITFSPHLTYVMLFILFLGLGFASSSQILSYPTLAESNPLSLISTATSMVALIVDITGALMQFSFGWMLTAHWQGQMVDGIPQYASIDWRIALSCIIGFLCFSFFATFKLKETHCRSLIT